jgi:isoquinoline 1-oxidoreductase
VRRELAEAFRLPETDVRVIVPDTGSGYGGKHTGDAALEAARLAKAADRPVKVLWTREEEFTWAYFRPAGVIDIRAAIDGEGKLNRLGRHQLQLRRLGSAHALPVAQPAPPLRELPGAAAAGLVPRSGGTANHFARETAMDELAALAKLDPLTFRERNLPEPRLRAVLRAAADRFGWGAARRSRPDADAGWPAARRKGGFVASCVELTSGRAAT